MDTDTPPFAAACPASDSADLVATQESLTNLYTKDEFFECLTDTDGYLPTQCETFSKTNYEDPYDVNESNLANAEAAKK